MLTLALRPLLYAAETPSEAVPQDGSPLDQCLVLVSGSAGHAVCSWRRSPRSSTLSASFKALYRVSLSLSTQAMGPRGMLSEFQAPPCLHVNQLRVMLCRPRGFLDSFWKVPGRGLCWHLQVLCIHCRPSVPSRGASTALSQGGTRRVRHCLQPGSVHIAW